MTSEVIDGRRGRSDDGRVPTTPTEEDPMTITLSPVPRPRLSLRASVVRPLLAVDADGCLLLGVVGAAGAALLDGPLGSPAWLLVLAGVALLAYGAEAAVVAWNPTSSGMLGLALANAVFALGAVAALLTASLTGLGTVVAVALTAISLAMGDVLLSTVAIGTVFEVALVLGVPLFDRPSQELAAAHARLQDRLALLPVRVRTREQADDDF